MHITDENLSVSQAKRFYKKVDKYLKYDDVSSVFDSSTSFETQLQAFLDKISLTTKETAEYELLAQELTRILQPYLPKCKVYMFGSTEIGTGFKNSDLDIYLNAGLPVTDNENVSGPHVISMDRLFFILERSLCSNSQVFSNLCSIRNAKMPIIKCVHKSTNISCDISFKHNLAVHNTNLLKFYLSISSQFRTLLIIIKYWLFSCKIRSNILMTNYALTMLFIFYLQQVKLVPPVCDLQRKCSVPVIMRGWQVNFNKSKMLYRFNSNSRITNIPKLLQGFFEFYMNYDFKNNVICPYDGNSYNRELLDSVETLPASMRRYKEYLEKTQNPYVLNTSTSMCVQDPIELNHNVSKNMQEIHMEKFQIFCCITAKIIDDSLKNNYQDLLQNMLKVNVCCPSNEPSVTFNIYPTKWLLLIITNKYFKRKSNTSFLDEDKWFCLSFHTIQQFLTDVLNLRVNSDTQINQSDPRSNNSIIKSITKNGITLHCKGSDCLWSDRKTVIVDEESISPLQKEILISKTILRKTKSNDDSLCTDAEFDCHILAKTEPNIHIQITLTDYKCVKKVFTEISNYLMCKLPSILKKTFNYMLSNKKNMHS